ncbi:UNVERIFIED_CONTAM: hypothetical protein FKN15_003320 [Acipenser sinensis]
MNTRCPLKCVPSAARFFTHCRLTMQPPRATASEDNAALGSLKASPQAPGQITGVAGARYCMSITVAVPGMSITTVVLGMSITAAVLGALQAVERLITGILENELRIAVSLIGKRKGEMDPWGDIRQSG